MELVKKLLLFTFETVLFIGSTVVSLIWEFIKLIMVMAFIMTRMY